MSPQVTIQPSEFMLNIITLKYGDSNQFTNMITHDNSSYQTIKELKETLIEMQHSALSGVYMECGITNLLGMDLGGNLGKGVGSKVAEVIHYWDKMMTIIKEWERNNRV